MNNGKYTQLPDDALSNIYSVLSDAKKNIQAPENAIQAFYAICQYVLQASKITFKMPQILSSDENVGYDALINTIAKSSQCRTRIVYLSDTWWKDDNGALLAFRSSDKQPIALIPRKNLGGYKYIDPETLKEKRITKDNAKDIISEAYYFYRSMPDKPLTWRTILKFSLERMLPDVRRIILMQIFVASLGLFIPVATGIIFDYVIPNADINRLSQFAIALLVNVLAITLFNIAQIIGVIRFQLKVNTAVQAGVWDRLLRLPVSFFRRFTAGDLAFRASGIDRIQQVITGSLMLSMISGAFSIITIALMFYYDAWIALGAIGLVTIIVLVNIFSTIIQLKYQRRIFEIQGKLAGFLLQLLTSISKLKVANSEARAFSLWSEKFSQRTKLFLKAKNIIIRLSVFQTTFAVIITAILFIMVVARSAELSFGSFIALNAAFAQFFSAVLSMTHAFSEVLQTIPLYERSKPILQTTPEPELEKTHPGILKGNIEIKRILFRYGKNSLPVFKELSLKIEAGEFVAIVGPSGAGKSSIFRLLLGFETPEVGAIYYDNHDLKSLNIPALRQQIGVVLQNSMLTPGTIFENVAGSRMIPEEQVMDVLELIGLKTDVDEMPMGLNTLITESGKTLSMGQRQRIMIARALLRCPRVLLLDEATSAVDNLTQHKIYTSLNTLNITRIVIAHRFSTIAHADRIYVIDKGEIIQAGRYEELLVQAGLFQDLAKRQIL